jgi:thiosulfate dehydrogenase [quinone] large subunit
MRPLQQFALIALRTAIGWHFAYEGFYKLMLPGWTRTGERLAPFSAAGYLKGATGPLASLFHAMAAHAAAMHSVDLIVPIGLLLVGLSLMLGLFTQLGCLGAMAFLALFYLSQPPLTGLPMTGAEGENLIVNKNLIELIAVIAVFSFRTGWMAGLDQLRLQRRRSAQAETAVGIPGVSGQRP